MGKSISNIVSLILVTAMVFSLTACKSTDSTTDSTAINGGKEETTAKDTAKNSAGTKLKVLNWGSTEEEKIANDAINRFKALNPDVEVEQTCVPVDSWSDFIQKWTTMITSGEAPDVINLGLEGARMAISNDLLLPLDDIVAADPGLSKLKEEYAPSLLEGFSDGGTLYGLPGGTQTMVMYYNKDIFDQKGIAYPKDGWTWDDFMETAKALTDKSVYGYGLSNTYFQLTPWWTTNSAYPVSGDYKEPTLTSEGMIESVTYLKKLVDEGVTPDPISSDVYTMFSSWQVAMVGAGRWVLNTWQDAGMKNFDCVQWPQNTEAGSVYGGSAWTIGSSSKNQKLAAALLKELVSDETLTAVAAGGQQIPPTEILANNPEIMGTVPENISGLWKAVTISSPVAAPTFYGDLEQSLIRATENVFSGSMSVEDAMKQAQSEVEAAVN